MAATRKHPAKKRSSAAARDASAVDAQLARYRAMRHFEMTAEPRGGSAKRGSKREEGLPFVIQKHAATRLHYDFRLGWRGVLKSWAVTKGPSYNPADKRLAVQVEDHPIEYGGFEGIIPKGQYGGGTVMVWDQGTWEPHGDADEGLAKGRLKFTLHGKKLRGDWALIRMGGNAAKEKKPNWLLIKEHDGNERGPDEACVTEEEPDSVVTGRTLEEIAASQDHVWGSTGSERSKSAEPPAAGSPQQKSAEHRAQRTAAARNNTASIPVPGKAPKESLPKFVSPQLAVQVAEAPDGDAWVHELKLDGYRIEARIDRSRAAKAAPVTLLTRSGLDWTHRMPTLATALATLPAERALLDGEVVVFDEQGVSSFARLQAAFQEGKPQPLTYVVFDLLHLDGHNLRGLALSARKDALQKLLRGVADPDTIRYSEHLSGNGADVFRKACGLGAEGIVSKKISAPYSSSRSGAWLKVKCVHEQEFVIGGFTPPQKSGVGIGALLLGYYRDGKLIYAGRTGTGFTHQARLDMRARLEKVRQKTSPFAALPAGASTHAIWVQPKYVCEVGFATWTADNLVRQASFQGLREDKPPTEIVKEEPVDAAKHGAEEPDDRATGNKPIAADKRKEKSASKSASKHAASTRPKKSSAAQPFPIPLTHPDKVIDAATRLTKRELADYFWAVHASMLPYIADRPLSIVRCPQGSTKPCFFQKHVAGNLPEGIDGIDIRGRRSGAVERYLTLSTPLGLAGLAQMGVLEIHPWGSRNEDIEKPDMLVFDLDPDAAISWSTLAESAREVRDRLKRECGLTSFLKTTGGKGLHVVAPIRPAHEWPVVKSFAHAFAQAIESENRKLYLTKMTKSARAGKIFIDYLRNDRGATSIAPYSPRAREGAPVAVPLAWKELDASSRPVFRVAEFSHWQSRLGHDPWKRMASVRQTLSRDVLRRFTSGPESD